MNATLPQTETVPGPARAMVRTVVARDIDASCRLPLLVMFLSGAVWLVMASLLSIFASLKFHAPALLANSAWLGYGRLKPAAANALLYGFCVQAGLGVALWLIA